MLSEWLLVLLTFVLVLLLLKYNWQRRHLYVFANKLPGPLALPIIGNCLIFLGKPEDFFKKYTSLASSYPKPFRMWFGPYLMVYFSDLNHIEKIVSSSKLTYKHDLYDRLMKIYLGNGLVSNSGPKYKEHRRLIQPLLNLNFVTGNFKIFQKHIDVLLDKLDLRTNGTTFDVHESIHYCMADIIGESIFGTNIDSQHGKNIDYVHASSDMYEVGYARALRPWLYPEIFYSLTDAKKDETRIIKTTTAFVKEIIENAWQRVGSREYELEQNSPIIDQISGIIRKDPGVINEMDFLYHMYNLYVASEDTLTIITTMLCMCLGMYPEYQALACEEIQAICGSTFREIMYDDVAEMHYIDMCIREILRLIPIAPVIVRKATENTKVGDLIIPKDCGIMISILDLHRDPKIWQFPNEFYPDHFLPEKVRQRHPFAYIPFSAGPRGCVGKVVAIVGLKLIIAKILQRFEIEADGKFPDIVLTADITVRSASGYNIRLKPRKWN